LQTISVDLDTINADWTKQSWDYPPYKSAEFFELVEDLDKFRKSPAYAYAVAQGLIHDDEWVADWAIPAKKTRDVHVHIHRSKP
jgi:hypothetical protein